jgi:hypothetical protein
MNWATEYIEKERYVKIICDGFFSIVDHKGCFDQLFASDFWKPGMNLLFDNRDMTFGQVNADKMRIIAEYYRGVSRLLGKCRIALLMSSTLGYGLGRQFQTFAEDKGESEIGVFSHEKSAVDWLTG